MAVCSQKVSSFLKRAAVVAVGVAAVFAAGEARAATYYLKPGGDDSAAGMSTATALKSLSVALAKDDVTEIQIAAGTYDANIGVYQGWMDGATDLAGNPRTRLLGGKVKVDAGCYQSSGIGFVLIVR